LKKVSHILIVAPSFPKEENQGIVIPPLQLYVRELKRKFPSLKISILALHFPYQEDSYEWNGCSIYPVNAGNGPLLLRPLYWLKAFRILKKIHRACPIDLVHSFWLHEPAFIAQRFASKNSIPHLATLMGQDAKASNRYLRFLRLNKIRLVCLSQFQKSVFESHASHTIEAVIPFGISDLDTGMPALSQNRIVDVIAVSSLIPLKRLDILIECVRKLKEYKKDIRVLLVGGGPLQEELQNQINALDLSQHVQLTGQLDRKTCLEKMNTAKIFVHTSKYEGQGYVVNEALALGCQVVSLNESFDFTHPDFFLVKTKEALVAKVSELLKEEKFIRKSAIPFSMSDTLVAYQHVLLGIGKRFE
jgi:glycosyltransferase involved in cell wall biosynthesis